MAVRAVAEPEADPKAGKPRPKSGVAFPYFDLDTSIEVAKAIHDRAGGVCDLPQLATLLKYSGVHNGSFRMRVSAAKMFGLVEEADGRKLRVAQRGKAIVAPVTTSDAARARAEAFLAVDLFKKVFDQYNGSTLPEEVGLDNLLKTEYRVVPDRVVPTRRIMLDSAEQAGFFAVAGNRSRMVTPLAASGAGIQTPPPVQPKPSDDPPARQGGGGNGRNGGGDGSDVDPAIFELVKKLPPGGTPLSGKRRKALIDAFTATVNFIYPDADSDE